MISDRDKKLALLAFDTRNEIYFEFYVKAVSAPFKCTQMHTNAEITILCVIAPFAFRDSVQCVPNS